MRLISIVLAFVAFTGCGQANETLCAEAVTLNIAQNGEVSVNDKLVAMDEVADELASLRKACGSRLRVALGGTDESNREAMEELISIVGGSDDVGMLQIVSTGVKVND